MLQSHLVGKSLHTSRKAKELMNQTMNFDTPPTEQRAKLYLLSEEEDGRILLLSKINSYIDDFDLGFNYLQFPCSSACSEPYRSTTEPKPEQQEPCKHFLHTLKHLEYTKHGRVKFRDILLCSYHHLQPLNIPLSVISILFYVSCSTNQYSHADANNFLYGNLLDAIKNPELTTLRGAHCSVMCAALGRSCVFIALV